MVLQASRFLFGETRKNSRPSLNESAYRMGSGRSVGHDFDYKALWAQLQSSAEFIGVVSTLVDDIFAEDPEWFDPETGEPAGRNKRLRVERFYREQGVRETMMAAAYDWVLTGDAYLWKGLAEREQVAAAYKEAAARTGRSIETKEFALALKQVIDEETSRLRKLDYVAAETVDIVHDGYEVQKYIQRALAGSAAETEFGPESIVHLRWMTVRGRIHGMSPAKALAAELLLLYLVKQNMISFMRNGGAPDRVFVLPEEQAGSANHDYLVDVLSKYKSVDNTHGTLVVSGQLEIEDLTGNPKDMEYKDLALYVTSNLALAYKIPVTRLPYLIGSAAAKGDNGGISDAGYWSNISNRQTYFENVVNTQLWIPHFGVAMRFPRRYKQDKIRDAQALQMNVDSLAKIQAVLAGQQKRVKIGRALALIGMSEDDVEEAPEILGTMPDGSSGARQSLLPNQQVRMEADAQARAGTKRASANARTAGAATQNP